MSEPMPKPVLRRRRGRASEGYPPQTFVRTAWAAVPVRAVWSLFGSISRIGRTRLETWKSPWPARATGGFACSQSAKRPSREALHHGFVGHYHSDGARNITGDTGKGH